MLYQIGTLTLDTRPFNADEMDRTGGSAFAVKPLMGTMQSRENMGEGDEQITLSGQLLPFKTGGLTHLEIAHQFRQRGIHLPVMRGDGRMFGWYVIEDIREKHTELMGDGVGFLVKHSIRMTRVPAESASSEIIGAMMSLFSVVGARR